MCGLYCKTLVFENLFMTKIEHQCRKWHAHFHDSVYSNLLDVDICLIS
jgi:hypothetical protein